MEIKKVIRIAYYSILASLYFYRSNFILFNLADINSKHSFSQAHKKSSKSLKINYLFLIKYLYK
jgi:hypothetical protein